MRETYDPDAILADPEAHPVHAMYAAINVDIRDNGARWRKCANCGEPYRLTAEWSSETVCGDVCADEFHASLFEDF